MLVFNIILYSVGYTAALAAFSYSVYALGAFVFQRKLMKHLPFLGDFEDRMEEASGRIFVHFLTGLIVSLVLAMCSSLLRYHSLA